MRFTSFAYVRLANLLIACMCTSLILVRHNFAFQKDATIITPRCGQTFTSSWGNFTYPEEFPHRPYQFGLKCRWTIRLPSQESKVQVTFPYLVLRSVDYLAVMDHEVSVGRRPCQEFFYSSAIKLLEENGSKVEDHLLIYRGALTGSSPNELVFSSASNLVVIELCPSFFPLANVDGLGLIVMWEDTTAQMDMDLLSMSIGNISNQLHPTVFLSS